MRPTAPPAAARPWPGDALWLLLVGVVPPALILSLARPFTIDDAFISFRYAHNLVRGEGLVFNPGEYVEGYTNLLWTLLAAIPLAAGVPVAPFAAVLGVALGVGAVLEVWRTMRRLTGSAPLAAVPALALGCAATFWLTAANGLEGGLVALLLARVLYLMAADAPFWRVGLAGGLLFLTRPDTLFVVPLCFAWRALAGRRAPAASEAAGLALWLLIGAAVTLWRAAYYGSPIPNTIAAKSPPREPAALLENVRLGGAYIAAFFTANPPLALALVLAPFGARRRPLLGLILALVACYLGVVLLNGGDWMPFSRLLAVYSPALALALGLGLLALHDTRPRHARWLAAALAILIVAAAVLRPVEPWKPWPALGLSTSSCYRLVATQLRPALRASDVVAPDAAGEFGFLTPETRIHDMWGLADEHIARHGTYAPRFGRLDRAYTLTAVRPALFVVHGEPWHFAELAQVPGGAFTQEYALFDLVGLREMPGCDARIMVAVRQDARERFLAALRDLGPQPMQLPAAYVP